MTGSEGARWRTGGVRWAQTGIMGTVLLLFARSSLKILDHEIKVARKSNMHSTDWGEALDTARNAQELVIWGGEAGFTGALVVVWTLVASVLITKYSLIKSNHAGKSAFVQAVLVLFAILGVYWLVATIIAVVAFEDISCSLDASANAMIDAKSRNVYVTCLKQDYTDDLFRRSFVPLSILLASSFLLSVFAHAEEESQYLFSGDSASKAAETAKAKNTGSLVF
tara:strand:+ start:481 stop:1152 length:672 start_codon:yes stop_codon:yes gene_type:complete